MRKTLLYAMAIVMIFAFACQKKDIETREYTANDYSVVEILTENGNITSDMESGDISIDFTRICDDPELIEIGEYISGDTLRIVVEIPEDHPEYSCDVDVTLPDDIQVGFLTFNGNITAVGHQVLTLLEAHNGNINVTNTAGTAVVGSLSGDINIENHNGYLEAEASDGTIDMKNTQGTADIESTSGDLLVDNHSGDITGQASNGVVDADVDMPKTDGTCVFSNDNGPVTVAVETDVNALVTLTATAGSINVDASFGMTDENPAESIFQGTLGDGSGTINLTSNSGDVRLNAR